MSLSELWALGQVILIDLVLAGDNAIVVGLAAASVPAHLRARVVFFGIAVAVVMRIGFAVITAQLLAIKGLMLAGGLLLLWVAWRFFEDLRKGPAAHEPERDVSLSGAAPAPVKEPGLGRAITQIVVADLSMSLDNVLAVSGASGGHTWVLVAGLLLSVILMGIAATLIAALLEKNRWIGWAGLAVILYVAVKMIWDGAHQLGWLG
jgi:YjbE family integral membrane protein